MIEISYRICVKGWRSSNKFFLRTAPHLRYWGWQTGRLLSPKWWAPQSRDMSGCKFLAFLPYCNWGDEGGVCWGWNIYISHLYKLWISSFFRCIPYSHPNNFHPHCQATSTKARQCITNLKVRGVTIEREILEPVTPITLAAFGATSYTPDFLTARFPMKEREKKKPSLNRQGHFFGRKKDFGIQGVIILAYPWRAPPPPPRLYLNENLGGHSHKAGDLHRAHLGRRPSPMCFFSGKCEGKLGTAGKVNMESQVFLGSHKVGLC